MPSTNDPPTPSSPVRALAVILCAAMLTVVAYRWQGGPVADHRLALPTQLDPTGVSQSVVFGIQNQLPGSMAPAIQSVVPQSLPSAPTSLPGKAVNVANGALDVTDDMVDTAAVAADTGGKVVRFGAGVVNQMIQTAPGASATAGRTSP